METAMSTDIVRPGTLAEAAARHRARPAWLAKLAETFGRNSAAVDWAFRHRAIKHAAYIHIYIDTQIDLVVTIAHQRPTI